MNFDEYAKNWDTEKRISRARVIAEKILESINIQGNYSAMEFGCGTGLVSFNLYNKFKKITLIDSSIGMIDILNSKIEKYKAGNMEAMYVDLIREDLKEGGFDVIFSSMVLHHINDVNLIIKKLYQLLNRDGYLCIVDLNEDDGNFHKDHHGFDGHNGFNQVELKGILTAAGFGNIESNTFFYDEKIIEGERIPYSLFLIKARKYE